MSDTVLKLPIGSRAPDVVNTVIEIPHGSHNKYEFDEELGVFKLDRVLYSPVHYPLDYGFIPETRSDDGDHLDMMVVGGEAVPVGCLVETRPVALLKMIDGGREDFKVLGVQARNPRLAHIRHLADIEQWNSHLLKEIVHFFEVYKHLEGKVAEIHGWEDAEAARAEIQKAQELYTKENP